MTIIPCILSGGSGTRLWPVSRMLHPKPFMRLPNGRTLLSCAFERATALQGNPGTVLITNREYAFQCQDEFLSTGSTGELCSILEPEGRNTAPAIAMAAHYAFERWGEDAVLLTIAADHLIVPQDAFQSDVDAAAALAREDWIVTFGVRPLYPETGYGYIEVDPGRPLVAGHTVRKFKEKPPVSLAEEFVLDGQHYWNSGIFCMRAALYLSELAQHQPGLAKGVERAWSIAWDRHQRLNSAAAPLELEPVSFCALDNISADYAVIERSEKVAMVPASFEWSDIGSWRSVSDLVQPDSDGNRIVGRAMMVDCKDTFIQSEHRLTAAVGVENLLIIDTDDALLIADRDRAQDVKRITDRLRAEGSEVGKVHRKVHRPWGSYTVLEEAQRHKMKRLELKPGARISLQIHYHRCEHWVVVAGKALVTRGDEVTILQEDQSTYIPAGTKHRLENVGTDPLIIIEVQTGCYLGEDDIVRLEDSYGRVAISE